MTYQVRNGRASRWQTHTMLGNKFCLEKGAAVTRHSNNGLPQYWFSGTKTVILGRSIYPPGYESPSETIASWQIPTGRLTGGFKRGFLVIGCDRRFGGLHCRKYDKRADIFLNGTQLDGFALRIKARGHSDYFQRIPVPATLPRIAPFSECQSLYAWPIREEFISRTAGTQELRIRVDREVRWDIDYVGILLEQRNVSRPRPRVFLSHSHADKAFVRTLAAKLSSNGIKVWVDEAEINPGDSLIEKLRDAIDSVSSVIAVLSPASIRSPWVKKELEIAMTREIQQRRVKVIPVIRRECPLPGFLEGKLYADFTTSYRRQKYFPALIQAIREGLQ